MELLGYKKADFRTAKDKNAEYMTLYKNIRARAPTLEFGKQPSYSH